MQTRRSRHGRQLDLMSPRHQSCRNAARQPSAWQRKQRQCIRRLLAGRVIVVVAAAGRKTNVNGSQSAPTLFLPKRLGTNCALVLAAQARLVVECIGRLKLLLLPPPRFHHRHGAADRSGGGTPAAACRAGRGLQRRARPPHLRPPADPPPESRRQHESPQLAPRGNCRQLAWRQLASRSTILVPTAPV